VTTPQRSDLLPDVAPIGESGVPGFADSLWFGVWARVGTPADIVAKLSRDISAAVGSAELREQFKGLGGGPMTMSLPEFSKFVRSESDVAARVAKAAGIKPQ
jgi:tripartite-type tricarboxylate transporter receptor subunit TctC